MNWYIGQEVVCVNAKGATDSKGNHSGLQEGKIYTIKSLRDGFCPCFKVLIDVGIAASQRLTACPKHHTRIESGNTRWFGEQRFAPLADITELEEILAKEPSKSVFGNQT